MREVQLTMGMRRMKVDKLGIDLLTHDPVVILKDLEGKRHLPILIGPFEATAIALALELANRRGLLTIAAGVETVEEYNIISELGVAAIQGYLAGAPMTSTEFEAGLRGGRWVERPEVQ